MSTPFSGFTDSKKHYPILDGLRGVAAIMVVIFHIFETFSGGDHVKQIVNHGYLAVDFFFVLSGFVIGYAYDDRWHNMSLGGFFKRRLIRLHPMIIMGMLIGAVTFYFQDSAFFPGIHEVPVWKMIGILRSVLPYCPYLLPWISGAGVKCIRLTDRHGPCSLNILPISFMPCSCANSRIRYWQYSHLSPGLR